jgi:Rrf2 family protein
MKLSTRARYGTRLLVDLALHYGEQPVLLKNIARRQEISLPYLQHLITPLVAGGIVFTIRGAKGGVSLSRPPGEIKLSEVIRLLEGSIAPVDCVNSPDICERSTSCVARDVWCGMKRAVDELLESTTLQDLAERQKSKETGEQMAYFI